jgi:hypothetical protein
LRAFYYLLVTIKEASDVPSKREKPSSKSFCFRELQTVKIGTILTIEKMGHIGPKAAKSQYCVAKNPTGAGNGP